MRHDRAVLLVEGFGVTPFLSVVAQLVDHIQQHSIIGKKIALRWTCRDVGLLQHVVSEHLLPILRSHGSQPNNQTPCCLGELSVVYVEKVSGNASSNETGCHIPRLQTKNETSITYFSLYNYSSPAALKDGSCGYMKRTWTRPCIRKTSAAQQNSNRKCKWSNKLYFSILW